MKLGRDSLSPSARGRAGYEAVLERKFGGNAAMMHAHLLSARHAPKVWCSRSQCYVRRCANV